MFKEVSTKVDFAAQERELLQFWKDTQAFQKLRHLHQGEPGWSFIDGPDHRQQPDGCAPRLGAHVQRRDAALPKHAGTRAALPERL